MRNVILILFFLVFIKNSAAQTEEKILNELIYDLFGLQDDTLLIDCKIEKTSFDYDSTTFENKTGLTVSKKIISEWKKNEKPDGFTSYWNLAELNRKDTIFIKKDTIICKKPAIICLSKKEIDSIFEKTKRRQSIYSISKLLFDNSGENAIFYFTVVPWPGDFNSETIFIKKVFGKWIILTRFDFMMS